MNSLMMLNKVIIQATTHWKVGTFYTNYDVIRIEKRTAELWVNKCYSSMTCNL